MWMIKDKLERWKRETAIVRERSGQKNSNSQR